MTDLEIVQACAAMMGFELYPVYGEPEDTSRPVTLIVNERSHTGYVEYDPLYDKAQAFALVEAFPTECIIAMRDEERTHRDREPPNLQRAICLCVAKMREGGK